MPRNPYVAPGRLATPPRVTVTAIPPRDAAATGIGDGDAGRNIRPIPAVALDMAEACVALNVSDGTPRKLLASGVVPGLKVGTRWMIPVGALAKRLGDLAEQAADARAANGRGRRVADDDLDGPDAHLDAAGEEGGRAW